MTWQGLTAPLIHKGPGHIDFKELAKHESVDAFYNLIKNSYKNDVFDSNPLKTFINKVKYLQRQALTAFCTVNLPPEAKDNTYCLKENLNEILVNNWKKGPACQTYELVLKHLEKALEKSSGLLAHELNTAKADPFLGDLYIAHQYLEAAKKGMVAGKGFPTVDYLQKLGSVFSFGKISHKAFPSEATNLVVPKELKLDYLGQSFLSANDLNTLKETDFDLSSLNPPNSFFWVRPEESIGKIDLSEDQKSIEETSVEYNFVEGAKLNGPRFIVTYEGKNWEIRFLPNRIIYPHESDIISSFNMRFGSNFVHTEPVLKKLAKALGYNVYPSIFKQKVKVFLGDNKEDFREKNVLMVNQIIEKFPDDTGVHKSLSSIKVDPISGKKYIELKSGSRHRVYEDKTVFPFSNIPMNSQGNQFKREYRAFPLFAAWVDLAHPGDALGSTMVDLKNSDFPFKHALYNLGEGLGLGYPNMFKIKFVRKVSKDSKGKIKNIVLN